MKPWLAAFLLLASACSTTSQVQGPLGRAKIAPDYQSFTLRRVGVLPFRGDMIGSEQGRALEAALASAVGRKTSYELIALEPSDLEEIPNNEIFRRGWARPDMVLSIARRYNLDAILAGTVTELQSFAPQKLCLEIDLIAVETGLPIWSASVQADAGHERVRQALESWYDEERASGRGAENLELYLLSPRRFAEFTVAQVAELL